MVKVVHIRSGLGWVKILMDKTESG